MVVDGIHDSLVCLAYLAMRHKSIMAKMIHNGITLCGSPGYSFACTLATVPIIPITTAMAISAKFILFFLFCFNM
jgi:hypothetical protein